MSGQFLAKFLANIANWLSIWGTPIVELVVIGSVGVNPGYQRLPVILW